ncbi:MAG: hypothetical protein ACI4SP_00790 [Eubacteriales bacterium]
MKRKTVIGWGLILVAGVFLLNPSPMLIDLLPDVIAFFLLRLALRRVASVMPSFEDVIDTGNKLLLVTALRVPALFIMLGIWGKYSNQRALIAVCCLVFAIIELCYLIPWVRRLFSAFYRLGEQYGCEAALKAEGKHFRLAPAKLEIMTIVFFCVRQALSCLPEMALVPLNDGSIEYSVNWNTLYIPLMLIAAVIVLVFGIVWFCYFSAYIRRMASVAETDALLSEKSGNRQATRRSRFVTLKSATLLYLLGAAATFDIYLDGMNYTPDLFAALFFCACGVALVRYTGEKKAKWAWIVPLVWGVAALCHTILFQRFFDEFTLGASERLESARVAYNHVLFSALASETLMAVSSILLFLLFLKVIKNGIFPADMDSHFAPVMQRTKKTLTVNAIIMTVFACLTAVVSFIYELTLGNTATVRIDSEYTSGFLTLPILDWFPLVVWSVGGIWFFLSLWVVCRLRDEAEANLIL